MHPRDVFCPTESVVFHLWTRCHRATFQADVVPDARSRQASQGRVRAALAGGDDALLLGAASTEPMEGGKVLVRRGLRELYAHTGVDFRAGLLKECVAC